MTGVQGVWDGERGRGWRASRERVGTGWWAWGARLWDAPPLPHGQLDKGWGGTRSDTGGVHACEWGSTYWWR